jgi:hypothetical protein
MGRAREEPRTPSGDTTIGLSNTTPGGALLRVLFATPATAGRSARVLVSDL